jgi:hypothetical protein
MNQTVMEPSQAALFSSRRRTIAGSAACSLLLAWIVASVLVHLVQHEVSDRATGPLLSGADIPPSVAAVLTHACVNCHSEKTQWPWYSLVAPLSWLVENDVKHAREHLNLSRWDDLQEVDQRMLLTAMATLIENHEMPPHRYLVLHPEAKLSADDDVRVIEWTRAERRRLRASASNKSPK